MEDTRGSLDLGPDTDRLRIQMLGGFSICRQGEPIKLERTNRTKPMHALQILLYGGPQGVPSEVLMEELFGEENVADPANNLKVTISNLRKSLRQAGLAQEMKVEYRCGSYILSFTVPVWLDIQEFSNLVEKRDEPEDQRLEKLLRAESLYEGDFLPHLNEFDWVLVASSFYREKYFSCLHQLAEILEKRKEWNRLLPIAARAASRYHLEEWQCLCIDCLIEMEQISSAWEAYRRIKSQVRKDSDSSGALLEKRLQKLKQLDKLEQGPGRMFEFLQDTTEENHPYYCSYASFVDLYRISCRVMPSRTKLSYLLIYSFSDNHGEQIRNMLQIQQMTQAMEYAINGNLGSRDVYTRYGKEFFLLLLIDATYQECVKMDRRIRQDYKSYGIPNVMLRCTISKVGSESLNAVDNHRWEKIAGVG